MAKNKRETGARKLPVEPPREPVQTGRPGGDNPLEPGPFGAPIGGKNPKANPDKKENEDAPGPYEDARRTAEEQLPREVSRK